MPSLAYTLAEQNASIPHLQGNGSLVNKEGRNVIASNKEGGIEAHHDKSEYNALYETDEGNLKHSEAQRYQISSLALAFLRFQHIVYLILGIMVGMHGKRLP